MSVKVTKLSSSRGDKRQDCFRDMYPVPKSKMEVRLGLVRGSREDCR